MLHTMFQEFWRRFLKVFTISHIYRHGDNIGHVTNAILFYKVMRPSPKKAPHEIWL